MTTNLSESMALRHELKHRIGIQEDLVLAQRLRKLFDRDKNAGPDGTYRVTSLYFDCPYDSALREKMDGVNRREKFRLRYYGTDTSFIRLEKKIKINGLCGKRSAPVTEKQVQMLMSGSASFLLTSGDPLLVELYSKIRGKCLRPRTIVCYDREAFWYRPGNVRITLDRKIRTVSGCDGFLNTDQFQRGVLDQYTVLEVKYDEFLPDVARMAVQVPGKQAEACSKYALCRRLD